MRCPNGRATATADALCTTHWISGVPASFRNVAKGGKDLDSPVRERPPEFGTGKRSLAGPADRR